MSEAENEGGSASGGEAVAAAAAQTPGDAANGAQPPGRLRRRVVVAAGACAAAAAIGVGARLALRPEWPRGAPLALEIGDLAPGQLRTVIWQDRPVWVLRRDAAMLATLGADDARLADPASEHSLQPPGCRNAWRALRPEIFVAIGQCTHQGCTPARSGDRFLCPCHASKYDLAGRVFKAGPAPANLVIPAHRFADTTRLVLGADA